MSCTPNGVLDFFVKLGSCNQGLVFSKVDRDIGTGKKAKQKKGEGVASKIKTRCCVVDGL